MVPVELRTKSLRNEPAPGERNSSNCRRIRPQPFFPADEIYGTRVGAQHDELSKSYVRLFRSSCRGGESFRTIARQSKNKRSQNVDAVLSKRLQALNQFVSREIEIFVNVFQSGRSDGFHSYQRAFNSCRFHRIQKFGVLGGLHGDLGEE